ncbi:MAG: hypothetical protein MUF42_10285 [Cytophagaceae bacterium]|jgi:hypothetical protein|nr:hypothetical protein [Cytophagaceae bacterium]
MKACLLVLTFVAQAQLFFSPVYFYSDSSIHPSPAGRSDTAWRGWISHRYISGLSELSHQQAGIWFPTSRVKSGIMVERLGTSFLKQQQIHFQVGHSHQQIAAGVSVGMAQTFTDLGFSRWYPSMNFYSSSISKNKKWISNMDFKQILSNSGSYKLPFEIRIASEYLYSTSFSALSAFHYHQGNGNEWKIGTSFRWSKYIQHQCIYHAPSSCMEMVLRATWKNLDIKVSGTVFHKNGLLWSCALALR